MTTVTVGSIVAEVEGEGVPVLMIHGLGGTTNMFQPQMEALRSYRVIRVDLPGCGRSPVPHEAPTFESYKAAVLAATKALGVEWAHVVGHSMGAILCQMLAAEEPGLVRSMILFGALAEAGEATRTALAARARRARTEGMAPIADEIVANALSSSTHNKLRTAVAFVRESLMRQNPEGYALACEALAMATAADPRLISAPTLLVTGDADAVNPPGIARDLADRIAGARLSLVEGGGHWLTIEKPAECNQRIAEFLKRVAQ